MGHSERTEKAIDMAMRYRGVAGDKVNEPEPYCILREFFPDYLDMTEEYLLADVMSRPGLTLREHCKIIIATLASIRFEGGLKSHMKWALNVGLSREEVIEIIMVVSRFAGWPEEDEILQLIDEMYPGFLKKTNGNPLEKVWSHPGITQREHNMITIAAFAALRFKDRLKASISHGLDSGLSRERILEIIMQVTPFAGWPVGTEALRIANAVFSSRE